jgi:hypothetical protein
VFTSSVNSSTTDRVSKNLYTDTANSLYYNPSSNTLTCTTFSGNLSGTASNATADASGNNIKSSYASDLGTYTRPVNSSSTIYGSIYNQYIALLNKNNAVLSRIYLSDIIANALRGWGGFGYGASPANSSSAGYRTYSSFGSVGSLGLFIYQPGIGSEEYGWYGPGRQVSGTALRALRLCYYCSHSFTPGNESGYYYTVVSHTGTTLTSSYTTLGSTDTVSSWIDASGDRQTGTWVLLSGSGYNTTYLNVVLAVRIL